MIIQSDPPLHLTYCLNVHPGETSSENFAAIREKALAVRQRVSPNEKLGLGLRLSYRAACELAAVETGAQFKEFLRAQNLYIFTINGFPYGNFHGSRVKENVYAPDWRDAQRRDYMNLLASLLADLLPENISGSISTVPCSFKPWITSRDEVEIMVRHLVDCVIPLAHILQTTGKEIHLGLEPEPSCFLETTDETIRFFNENLFSLGSEYLCAKIKCSVSEAQDLIRRHVGVCFDTCHVALQFEDLDESLRCFEKEGVRISKVQISAALRAKADALRQGALESFCEPVYLHQVKARRSSGGILSWTDLPDALREMPDDVEEARVHFHVPLHCEKFGALKSTASLLTPEFFARLRSGVTSHLEIETYTFDVLPNEMRAGGVVESIAHEFAWAQRNLGFKN